MFSHSFVLLALLSALGAYILNGHPNLSGWTIPSWAPFARSSPAPYVCETPRMEPHFLSYDPIMVYIENFLTPYETAHLKALALPHYRTSVIQNKAPEQHIDPATRNSQTAWLLSPDAVVDCVRARAAAFQGFAPNGSIDALAAVKYDGAGQQYRAHYDWDVFNQRTVDRRTSFFAVLDAECTGGATRFPEVRRMAWGRWGSRGPWCRWVECGEGREEGREEEGLAVRPVEGNALFWVNFREDGTGHEGTLHAGMPVVEGTKIGLNIWTYGKVKAAE